MYEILTMNDKLRTTNKEIKIGCLLSNNSKEQFILHSS